MEMSRLLQLILGCAVNCEDKQEYIQSIMSMEEQVQHMVMQAIQEVWTSLNSFPPMVVSAVSLLAQESEKNPFCLAMLFSIHLNNSSNNKAMY